MVAWRKLGVFVCEVLMVMFGIGYFFAFFNADNFNENGYRTFLALVLVTAIFQLVCAFYTFKYIVPKYLWLTVAVLIFLVQFWQGMAIAVLSVS